MAKSANEWGKVCRQLEGELEVANTAKATISADRRKLVLAAKTGDTGAATKAKKLRADEFAATLDAEDIGHALADARAALEDAQAHERGEALQAKADEVDAMVTAHEAISARVDDTLANLGKQMGEWLASIEAIKTGCAAFGVPTAKMPRGISKEQNWAALFQYGLHEYFEIGQLMRSRPFIDADERFGTQAQSSAMALRRAAEPTPVVEVAAVTPAEEAA